jgi:amino acid permease
VNEIRNPTQKRIDGVSVASITTAFTIYMIVAIAGFYTYGDQVQSNILISYPSMSLTHLGLPTLTLL